ncbi:MAG: hypothetical protein H6P99_266 [Holophagaceae bacterium]|nr:hypothetical protein [Holophagaceae bacterium]
MMAAPAMVPMGAPPPSTMPATRCPKKLMPVHPKGAKGCQLVVVMKKAPTAMTKSTAATLMATMTPLKVALSWIPFTRMAVMIATMRRAGRFIMAPVLAKWPVAGSYFQGDSLRSLGMWMPMLLTALWK